MLSHETHPVAWAMLMYGLDDAHEHLGALVDQMQTDGEIDEAEFAVYLGHVFAHLNRAWNGRDDPNLDNLPDELWKLRSRFPVDLSPVG